MQIFTEKEYTEMFKQYKNNTYSTELIIPFFTNKQKVIKNYIYENTLINIK